MRLLASLATSSSAEAHGAIPVGLGGLRLEGLLEQHLVAGILRERVAVEGGGVVGIVLVLGEVGGEIAAEQRVELIAVTRCIARGERHCHAGNGEAEHVTVVSSTLRRRCPHADRSLWKPD